MGESQSAGVTDEQRETFARDGVVCLRGLFDPAWLARLADGIEEVMANPSKLSRNYAPAGQGTFFTDVFNWRNNPQVRDFVLQSPAGEAAAAVMGSRSLRLYNDHLLIKEPGTDVPTLWHQDMPYFRIDGQQACSVWIGLDPVKRETGAMSFVKGSHKWGKMFRPISLGSGEHWSEEAFDGDMPDIDADPNRYETVCYEMEPGDCTIHHVLTVHGAKGNSNPVTRRRGFSIRVAGDDVTWLRREFSATGIETDLQNGEALHGDMFPQLWPKSAVLA
jgi:ectoine hydroxylase-related dioxygenase (phytanoyl-CoA dioxygenase family)